MKEYILEVESFLPRPRTEVFQFFANAQNLQSITPPWLKFEVLTPAPIIMRPGSLIDYRITVHGLPVRWRAEIAEWEPPYRFVDVQLRGPYTLWHHTHSFEESDGGTRCLDRVRYRPRGGALIHWLFVGRDVERIFQYRQQRLRELFSATVNKSDPAYRALPHPVGPGFDPQPSWILKTPLTRKHPTGKARNSARLHCCATGHFRWW